MRLKPGLDYRDPSQKEPVFTGQRPPRVKPLGPSLPVKPEPPIPEFLMATGIEVVEGWEQVA